MNFEPIDYLLTLNLDFSNTVPSTEVSPQIDQQELDLFTQAANDDFFSLDVFGNGDIVPIKQQESVKHDIHSTFDLPKPFSRPIKKETASASATDDKRKRNTAASARFRIKKKMKEQEMERRAKELEERVVNLEKKLKAAELENRCLKNIIFQQNQQKGDELLQSIKQKSFEFS